MNNKNIIKSETYFKQNRPRFHERFTGVMDDTMQHDLYSFIDDYVDLNIRNTKMNERGIVSSMAMQGILSTGNDDSEFVTDMSLNMADLLLDKLNNMQ